jgi:hypothetical protein
MAVNIKCVESSEWIKFGGKADFYLNLLIGSYCDKRNDYIIRVFGKLDALENSFNYISLPFLAIWLDHRQS